MEWMKNGKENISSAKWHFLNLTELGATTNLP